jgi:hypothetical protein
MIILCVGELTEQIEKLTNLLLYNIRNCRRKDKAMPAVMHVKEIGQDGI